MNKTPSTVTVPGKNGIGYTWEYAKTPDDRTTWQKIKTGIWDPETHQFLGRTGTSWGGIFLFYLIFYGALAGFFAICMKCLLLTIHDDYPKWQLDSSIIGTNPGMGYRPMAQEIEKGSIIWFTTQPNNSNIDTWVKSIDEFLTPYNNSDKLPPGGKQNQVLCKSGDPPPPGKVCAVPVNDPKHWGPCVSSTNYSYSNASPCVFIKLNRIYGWAPEVYDPSNLPGDMPEDLQKYIKAQKGNEVNHVWVSCHGLQPVDNENIGPIRLYPKPGFPTNYYPFTNIKGYLSPLIAIHFQKPARQILMNVECRAWAKNIQYKRSVQNREGSVNFELLID